MMTSNDSKDVLSELFQDIVVQVEHLRHLLSNINCVYMFEITSQEKAPFFWTLNLKVGDVYPGKPTGDQKADCTYVIDENDLILLLKGSLNSAQAYLRGKLKISGNSSAAFKLQNFLSEARLFIKQQKSESSEQSTLTMPSKVVSQSLSKPNVKVLEPIPLDGLKSDVIFEIVRNRIAIEPELFKKILFLIQINLTKNGKPAATWTIDTKSNISRVYRSSPPNGTKPDAIMSIEDDDYVRILFGKLNPQRAFMSGKVKVKGNIMLLQRLDNFWNQIQTTRNDPEIDHVKAILLGPSLKAGLRSEIVMFDLIQRLVRQPNLLPANTSVQFNITKNGEPNVTWVINYNESAKFSRIKRIGNDGKPFAKSGIDLELTVEDDEFVYLTRDPTYKLKDAMANSKVQIEGNKSLVTNLEKLFLEPALVSKL